MFYNKIYETNLLFYYFTYVQQNIKNKDRTVLRMLTSLKEKRSIATVE